jgi:nitrogen fixation protein FixH
VHILTKVFVLFAAVLSIMMAALAISFSVNADRILADYDNALAKAQTAENALTEQAAGWAQAKSTLNEDLKSLQDELASRDADTRRLEASNSELRISLRQAQSERISITSKIAQLGVTTETQANIISEYKDELSRLRLAELTYRDQKIDLEKQLGDLESQVIVYEQVKRALQEQLEEVRHLVDNPGSASTVAFNSNAATEIPGAPISGRVDEVRTDPNTGDLLVKINLGTNDRIANNSRMYIHRSGTTYLGELVVFRVDMNHAVGRIAYTVPGQSIREGDQVLSKLGS